MSFTGTVTGVSEAQLALGTIDRPLVPALHRGVTKGVLAGQTIVRGYASGRPGPRVITGNFRRSITADSAVAGTTVLGQIGSNAAQARRLEYGFYGTDVLGRNYSQPPYPSFQPAVPEVTRVVLESVSAEVRGAL